MDSLTLKHYDSFQKIKKKKKKKVTHNFAPRLLIFKLQKEVLKFSQIF